MPVRKIKLYATPSLQPEISSTELDGLTHEETFYISSQRSAGEERILSLDDQHCVELTFSDQTVWFGNADTLDEVFPQMQIKKRGAGDVMELPLTLGAEGEDRGLTDIALKIIKVFAKKAIQLGVAEIAAKVEKKLLDNQSGLYGISPDFILGNVNMVDVQKPALLFIHGTGSSTLGSFSELKGSGLWEQMIQTYGEQIMGFQHETLTKSPLQNVLELLEKIPDQANLHLITHSRGGLVGDLLTLFVSGAGMSEMGLLRLKKEQRTQDLAFISGIQKVLKKKNIQISKYIRVACPANGTSLLSTRIDTFFNVMLNLASLASGNNVLVQACKEMISAVIDSKNQTTVLPGLEAMNPDSVLLKVLNTPENVPVKTQLAVIAGNSGVNLSLKALKVLLMRIAFQSDNDLVVNTLSMYQGAKRKSPVLYFFDEGPDVNHFSYFKNRKTQTAISSALRATGEQIPSFREYQLTLSEDDRGIFGLEYGAVHNDKVSGKRPIIVLLPGIMGSNLEKNNRALWIHYLRLLRGDLMDLGIDESGIKATSLIKTSYKDLYKHLSKSYDVVTFPYDWRLPVPEAGKLLKQKIEELLTHKQTIKLLGHSMGGLVIRELMIDDAHQSTWKKLQAQPGFRILLLGTPWLGSYRIPNVLAGRDGIIKTISKLDLSHTTGELVDLFAKFPGILSLLPVHGPHDFSDPKVWKKFVPSTGLNYSIPDQVITQFAEFQKKVKNKVDHLDYSRMVYVAGKDDSTPESYDFQNGALTFNHTMEGDQSVTWASGIPSGLDRKNALYYVNVSHGALANDEDLFDGIKEILDTGSTAAFDRTPDRILESSKGKRAVDDHVFELNDESVVRSLMGLPKKKMKTVKQLPAIRVSVTNGDLQFSKYPIMIGHFFKDGIISAEKVADQYMGGQLSLKHSLGIYPGVMGSNEVLLNAGSGFKGVVIIGLGMQEDMSVSNLSGCVEKAALSYMIHQASLHRGESIDQQSGGVSVLLIGSFYGGMPVINSIRAILQGVTRANQKLQVTKGDLVRPIGHVEFVEVYEDRALQCFNTLDAMIESRNEELQIEWQSKTIRNEIGLRKRIPAENIHDWWHRITVLGNEKDKATTTRKLSFYSSTTSAREEKQDLDTNTYLLESLMTSISVKEEWSAEKAKAIFELLIPNGFKNNIHSQNNITWVLDTYAASFPWELLQTSLEAQSPLCIGARMIRQLATADYKENVNPSKSNRALIIGDPDLEGYSRAPQLPGAKREAEQVHSLLTANRAFDAEQALVRKRKDDIMVALLKTDYKIIHLASHGVFDPEKPDECGMLIGKHADKDEAVLLTTKEITQMSNTPELVFVNCCFLGQIDEQAEVLTQNRNRLAANIGTQLIRNGVKAVVVAGWAVNDTAALEFANVFYKQMLNGANFGDAIFEARKSTYHKFSFTNTWGAYQCYGDPFYTLKSGAGAREWNPSFTIRLEALIELDNLISGADLPGKTLTTLTKDLQKIVQAIDKAGPGFRNAEIIEKEAFAYTELNMYPEAIDKFRELFQSGNATYTLKALERYHNLRSKNAYKSCIEGGQHVALLKEIEHVIHCLLHLQEIADTSERYSLLGSTYKRKSAILIRQGAPELKVFEAMELSAFYYSKAFNEEIDQNNLYSLCNWIEVESFLIHSEYINRTDTYVIHQEEYQSKSVHALEEILNKNLNLLDAKRDPDYWDMISKANVALALCLLHKRTAPENIQDVLMKYKETWLRAGSMHKKQSELEHFDLLIDFCQFFGTYTGHTAMEKAIQSVRDELQHILAV
ncbi:MAG: CHAT domain-containing protein [Chitinophagaceae bacterium]|nr:CHAT domain-containing protein [Chitinophagaceae bacterium]